MSFAVPVLPDGWHWEIENVRIPEEHPTVFFDVKAVTKYPFDDGTYGISRRVFIELSSANEHTIKRDFWNAMDEIVEDVTSAAGQYSKQVEIITEIMNAISSSAEDK